VAGSVGEQKFAGFGHRAAGASCGEYVGQRSAARMMEMHIIGGNQRDASFFCQAEALFQFTIIVGAAVKFGKEI